MGRVPAPMLTTLVTDLASPDPEVRDERALTEVARLVDERRLATEDRAWLGQAMLERLEHPRAEARAFAPLVLATLVGAGDFDDAWVPAVSRWWVGERDLRGHDAEVGWVHAVAHGADFYGACGAAAVGDAGDLLAAVSARLVEPTDTVWRDQEDDRVAHAVALVLTRDDVDAATAVGWLDPVRSLFAAGEPGPVPAHVTNAMRTLRSLEVALGNEVLEAGEPVRVPHAATVRAAVSGVLALVTPWFWRPRTP
jgi:hypothetical protein